MSLPTIAAQPDTDSAAVLILEDGTTLWGKAYGARGETLGEVVFATAMTGYQETITDPSYARQILVQTAPHIGNTGVNEEDNESKNIWVSGYIVRDPARRPSNWRSTGTLDDALVSQGVIGIQGIDTRALTRHLRERGAMRGGIFSGEALQSSPAELLEKVKNQPGMEGANLSDVVSTTETYTVEPAENGFEGEPTHTIAALDLGIKAMTPKMFAARGVRVHVIPASSTLEDIENLNVDGVFFSNGPGDPIAAREQVALLRQVLDKKIPFFGICFGNQLLGRALGFGTYKLRFGHRGINQPVMDKNTGKVEITSQNHGFAVNAPIGEILQAPEERYGRARVSHVSLNDEVVEGLECLDLPAFSVQYHPEAAAGPHDSAYLFDRFIDLMNTSRNTTDSANDSANDTANDTQEGTAQ